MTEQISTLAQHWPTETSWILAEVSHPHHLHQGSSLLHVLSSTSSRAVRQTPRTRPQNSTNEYLRLHIIFTKTKTAAHKSVGVYVAAIRKFYSMNDVQLNWDKIHSFEGDDERQAEDRPTPIRKS